VTLAKLELVTVDAKVAELKSKVQRVNPVTDKADYLARAAELFSLEQHARSLRERAAGEL
jgi:DNA primase